MEIFSTVKQYSNSWQNNELLFFLIGIPQQVIGAASLHALQRMVFVSLIQLVSVSVLWQDPGLTCHEPWNNDLW